MELITIELLYFLIGLIASTLGAMSGIGGGIVIKPVLDFAGNLDVGTISILSASTVFSMAVVSIIIIFLTSKIKLRFKTSGLIAVSSIIGGITGKLIFNILIKSIENKMFISFMQSIFLTLLMLVIYIYQLKKYSIKTYKLENIGSILAIGFSLGIVAAFLGIGGGPFNVALLSLLFSMPPKEASLNSLFIVFFSQLSALTTTGITTGFSQFELDLLPYIVASGLIGGFIGGVLMNRVQNHHVDKIFSVALVVVIFINVINVGKAFMYL